MLSRDEKAVKKAQARAQGRTANRAGQHAEDAVATVCAWYEAQGWAVARKRPTPTKVVGRRGGRPVVVHSEPAGVDYSGTARGPRAVHFELKTSGTASLALQAPDGEPTLKKVQAAELAAAHALGAVAAVLVRVKSKPRGEMPVEHWFWLPWTGWQAAVAAAEADGRKSLGLDLLLEHGVEVAPHPLLGGPDWLLALEAAEGAS